ncbi:hypothetical protein ZOSMA_164G00240 [Zostera marina]|uniref:Uncharacterized protein n=1 Tax=Zostera marina TaxID=29655 RepID=A0A0K9PW02_ZOSMR|nr:hypothetical protein ZOSMA_164G00240 [Zostera marina]
MAMLDKFGFKRDATSFPFLDYFNSLCSYFQLPISLSLTHGKIICGGMGSRDLKDGGVVSWSHTEEDDGESPMSTIIESTVGAATEWTDKKHSLYLNSMEQSFINQLYQYHSHDSPVTARTNSSQRSSIKVQRGGGEFPEFKNKPHSFSGSRRRFGHFRSANTASNSSHHLSPHFRNLLHQDYVDVDDNAEVSDQNFVDEDNIRTDNGQ